MKQNGTTLQKIRKEFLKFERTIAELHYLKQIAEDLKNYRKMIKLKKYD